MTFNSVAEEWDGIYLIWNKLIFSLLDEEVYSVWFELP